MLDEPVRGADEDATLAPTVETPRIRRASSEEPTAEVPIEDLGLDVGDLEGLDDLGDFEQELTQKTLVAVEDTGDVHAFALAPETRLGDGRPVDVARIVRGGQQVRMAAVALPQQGQQRLVRQHLLPRRLDPARGGMRQVHRERLHHQPLPRIQLEQGGDAGIGEVDEAVVLPADAGDIQQLRREARLRAGLAQVLHRHPVLDLVQAAGEVHARMRRQDVLPAPHQRLVDQVELVGAGAGVFQPVPLHDRGLQQRGRRVRVVLEQLRHPMSIPRDVHAPVQRGLAGAPGTIDQHGRGIVQAQPCMVAAPHHLGHRFQAQRVQLSADGLEQVDVALAETETRVFDPVRRIQGVEIEAQCLDPLAPVAAGRNPFAAHQEPAARTRPLPPKPPR